MSIVLSPELSHSYLEYSRMSQSLEKSYSRLSSGLKLEQASDAPSDYAVSNGLRSQAKVLRMARQNLFDGLNFIQVSDSIMEEATNLLTRAAELSTQAASGVTGDEGRLALDEEYQAILAELDRLNLRSEFNDLPIFGNSFAIQFGDDSNEQLTVSIPSIDSTSFSLNGSDLTSTANADSTLQLISEAIDTLSQQRGLVSAKANRMRRTLEFFDKKIEDTTQTESTLRDADIATEVNQMTVDQIHQQGAKAALAHANLSSQRVLTLFA